MVKQFAHDMRQAFSDETGFSYSNVKYMKHGIRFIMRELQKANDPLAKLVTKLVTNLRTLKKATILVAKLKM